MYSCMHIVGADDSLKDSTQTRVTLTRQDLHGNLFPEVFIVVL